MSYKPALAVLCLAASSCSRSPSSGAPERLGILRFENLSADPSLDWMGRAFSEVVSHDLASAPDLYAITPDRLHSLDAALGKRASGVPGISSERALAEAAGANRIGYGEYWRQGANLEARLTLQDLPTGKTQVLSASGANIVETASALAQQVSKQAAAYGTRNPAAIRAYVTGLEQTDPAAAERDMEEAISADRSFGPPYEFLAQLKLQQRDPADAAALLTQAVAHRDGMTELDRARLAFTLAGLQGDAAGRRAALAEQARLTPNDPAVWASLGQLAVDGHQYLQAVQAYEKALGIQPDDPALLNQLGYADAYAGNLAGAVRVLQRYQTLRPNDANPLDSLGDVHLLSGRLRDAENFYLQAAAKNPSASGAEYRKAAWARLMTGDTAGASALNEKFMASRAQARDPLIPYYGAEWSWISGSRKQAYRQLASFAQAAENGPLPQAAAEAYAELAIWSVAEGNRTAAAEMAQKAALRAGPASAATVAIARFLAQPSASAAEWTARAASAFPQPAAKPLKDRALAYALLADRRFAAAAQILKPVYANGGDDTIAVLLAWCEIETGNPNEATALLRFNPLPPRSAIDPFPVFYFPRLFYLRGKLASQSGQPDTAREQSRLFLQLSGDTPLGWGEESQAR